MTKLQSVSIRFLKGFVSGGLASVAALINAGVTISSLDEFANFGFALLAAFVTGGLLAIEKLWSWQP